ncbi:MAG: hypothetical protein ACK5LY_07295 [Lachnospirales bacterium]
MEKNIKKFERFSKETIIYSIIIGFGYIITIFILSSKTFRELYLVDWILHNNTYFYILLISIFLMRNGKSLLVPIIYLGSILGIILGVNIGNLIYDININQMNGTMTAEEVYTLSYRYDVFIWFFTVFLTMICFYIYKIIKMRNSY